MERLVINNLSKNIKDRNLLLSLIFGMKFQSTNISLIIAIVSIVIIGNVVTNSYIFPNYTIFLMSIFSYLFIYFEIKYLSSIIVNDDVIY